eukprot:COSAG02_NODE_953_length_15689_cov_112.180564_7_plen_167_part_00
MSAVRLFSGQDLVPLGDEQSFESHICYGSVPVHVPGEHSIREYYFGGDGPHYGTRNSSLALITFREAGLAGVGAPPHWHAPVSGQTKLLTVTDQTVVVTADTETLYGGGENPGGSPTLDNVGKLTVAVQIVVRSHWSLYHTYRHRNCASAHVPLAQYSNIYTGTKD